jgi:hypothetical protein
VQSSAIFTLAAAMVHVDEPQGLIKKSPHITSQMAGELPDDDQRRSFVFHTYRGVNLFPIPEDTYNSGPYMLCYLAPGVAPATCYVELMHSRI